MIFGTLDDPMDEQDAERQLAACQSAMQSGLSGGRRACGEAFRRHGYGALTELR